MKKIVLATAISVLTTTIGHAQSSWSFGLRMGVEQLKYHSLQADHNGLRLQQQIFVTKKICNRLEIEGHFAYLNPYTNNSFSKYINDGPNLLIQNSSTTNYNLGINMKYHFLQRQTWSFYGIIGALANKTNSTTTSYNDGYISWGGYYPEAYNTYKYNSLNILNQIVLGVGINKNICEHFYLNGQFLVGYDTDAHSFMGEQNMFIPKLQIGLAYCL